MSEEGVMSSSFLASEESEEGVSSFFASDESEESVNSFLASEESEEGVSSSLLSAETDFLAFSLEQKNEGCNVNRLVI